MKELFGKEVSYPFINYFKQSSNHHSDTLYYFQQWAINTFVPKVNTVIYGINSIKYISVEVWNKLQKALPEELVNLTVPKFKGQTTLNLHINKIILESII